MSDTPIVAEAEKQEKILNALQGVLDPEIGISVIDLDLIREVRFEPEEVEIRMVLTTPFCPYGPMLINQIQSVSEQAAEMPVKVTLLPDKWEAPPWLAEPLRRLTFPRPAAGRPLLPRTRLRSSHSGTAAARSVPLKRRGCSCKPSGRGRQGGSARGAGTSRARRASASPTTARPRAAPPSARVDRRPRVLGTTKRGLGARALPLPPMSPHSSGPIRHASRAGGR